MEENNEDLNKRKLLISFSWFVKSLKDQIVSIFSVREGADIPGTIEGIKKDTEFRGHNIWILVFSIFIASIGLNLNSTAVIIGAMLISPLMGPILGLGLAVGTNDIKLLITSIRNLAIMIIVSVLASYIFFKLSPITESSLEISSRTSPHLFDALIAIFGGLAGIIGNSRSERTNIIPGVAIATALMPPLCVVGYAIATENYDYLWGASYLFLLNSSFIAITAIVVVRIMRFPRIHFVESKSENKVKIAIFIFAVLLIVPSIQLFRNVSSELKFKRASNDYLKHEFNFKESYVLKTNTNFDKDSISTIEVFILGEPLDSNTIINLDNKKHNYDLSSVNLIIRQGEDKHFFFENEIAQVSQARENYKEQLQEARSNLTIQDGKIHELKLMIDSLKADSIHSESLMSELLVHYPELTRLKGSWIQTNLDSTTYRIPLFWIAWSDKIKYQRMKNDRESKIEAWLKLKLKSDTIIIVH